MLSVLQARMGLPYMSGCYGPGIPTSCGLANDTSATHLLRPSYCLDSYSGCLVTMLSVLETMARACLVRVGASLGSFSAWISSFCLWDVLLP